MVVGKQEQEQLALYLPKPYQDITVGYKCLKNYILSSISFLVFPLQYFLSSISFLVISSQTRYLIFLLRLTQFSHYKGFFQKFIIHRDISLSSLFYQTSGKRFKYYLRDRLNFWDRLPNRQMVFKVIITCNTIICIVIKM